MRAAPHPTRMNVVELCSEAVPAVDTGDAVEVWSLAQLERHGNLDRDIA